MEKLASTAAKCAVSLAKGDSISELSSKYGNMVTGEVKNGDYMVPYCQLEVVMVNIDNIDKVIIDSGFHTKEDVYLNIK